MKIGIIAPFAYPIPPASYGGSEQVVYYLTEGLVKKGHDVTLFCQEGSKTHAKQDDRFCHKLAGELLDKRNIFPLLRRINYIIGRSSEFDLIHNHSGYLVLNLSKYFGAPMVTTLHNSYSSEMINKDTACELFGHNKFVSISKSQQRNLREVKFTANVYNGTVDLNRYQLGPGGDYLIWVGRFCDAKGTREAIEIAKKSGNKLLLAAKESPEDREYFEKYVKNEIDNKNIIFVGEIGIEEKNKLLGKAKAFLMPINWEEPFGLVMIESMACGTPVIAYDRGSVPEIIKNGETGFIVKHGDIGGMVKAVNRIDKIDRHACREHVEHNFSIEKMVEGYEAVYKKIINIQK